MLIGQSNTTKYAILMIGFFVLTVGVGRVGNNINMKSTVLAIWLLRFITDFVGSYYLAYGIM